MLVVVMLGLLFAVVLLAKRMALLWLEVAQKKRPISRNVSGMFWHVDDIPHQPRS